MVYEAVLVEFDGFPSDFTIADGTAIAKGTLLQLTTPRTAIAATGLTNYKAGIAAREKVASDGRTNLAVYDKGKFLIYVSGAVVAGQQLGFLPAIATYPNHLAVVNSGAITASGGQVVAVAEQAHADATLSAILCRLVHD